MTEPVVIHHGEARLAESVARSVTFFEDRAEVVRTARVRVSRGRSEPWIAGLSLFVDDTSLRVRVRSGAAQVLSASVVRRSRMERALSDPALEQLVATRDEARREALRRQRAIERIHGDADRMRATMAHVYTALAKVPAGVASDAVAAQWRDSYSAIVAQHEASATRLLSERAALVEAQRKAEAAQRAHADGSVQRPKMVSMARVQIEAREEVELELELVYRVPCALWRPEHVARLDRVEGKSEGAASVQWTTVAVLWQRTGEHWDNVDVRLSTARPARAASPPLAKEELLSWRRKTDAERQRIVVDAREQSVAVAGLDRGARSVAEMPGVDDGGDPVAYRASAPVTLPSSSRPVRVEVARCTLDATVDRVLYPEKSAAPHLRATMTWSGTTPLLAGPVRVSRGPSVVGRSRVSFVARGEPFELGFGTDDAVRVRRRVDERRDTVPVIGTQKVWRVVRVFLSHLSGESRAVRVIERVPISEIADVEVQLLGHEGWRPKASDGLIEREVTLGPRECKELQFEYELRASAKVELPF